LSVHLPSQCRVVAYDEELADRIREIIGPRRNLREQRMFGGVAFMVSGNLAVGLMGTSERLIVRIDPKEQDRLMGLKGAGPFEMRGRAMRGWLTVETSALCATRDLERWVRRGVAWAESLLAKR
jgi:TfoX/Sxy family transcriptional regulator of competence genes